MPKNSAINSLENAVTALTVNPESPEAIRFVEENIRCDNAHQPDILYQTMYTRATLQGLFFAEKKRLNDLQMKAVLLIVIARVMIQLRARRSEGNVKALEHCSKEFCELASVSDVDIRVLMARLAEFTPSDQK